MLDLLRELWGLGVAMPEPWIPFSQVHASNQWRPPAAEHEDNEAEAGEAQEAEGAEGEEQEEEDTAEDDDGSGMQQG